MKVIVRPSGIYINGDRYNYTILDNLIRSPLDLLDIDMFGSEIDVLKGAAKTIIVYRPELLITLHEDRIMKERERIIGLLNDVFDIPMDIIDEREGEVNKLHIFIRDTERAISYFRGRKFEYYRKRGPEPIMYFTGWTSEVKLREKLLRPDEVVYDLGAHIGGWTIPAALIGKHVYSFEPDIDCVQILQDNININNLQDKVTVHNVGLGGKVTSCFSNNITSDSRTLDSIVWGQALTPPDLIKIDVEGAELEVIRGARRTIKKFKPRIFFEAHIIDHGDYNTYEDVMKTVMEFVPSYHTEVDKGSWCIYSL